MALFNKEPEKKGPAATTPGPSAPLNPASSPASPTGASAATKPQVSSGSAFDRGTKVTGKVSFDGPARIDGEIEGEVNAKDSLTIGESGVITAQIRAASVTVAGKVSGDINASHRIEIRSSAKVIGNLAAPVLVVHEGASFEGHCTMQPEGAREDRKVTVFPKEERLTQAVVGQKLG